MPTLRRLRGSLGNRVRPRLNAGPKAEGMAQWAESKPEDLNLIAGVFSGKREWTSTNCLSAPIYVLGYTLGHVLHTFVSIFFLPHS